MSQTSKERVSVVCEDGCDPLSTPPIEGAEDKTLIRPKNVVGRLAIRIGLENGISFSINDGNLPLSIGRGRDCDIRIPLSDVSRQHCELFIRNNTLFLKDTSTNGTIVGGKSLRGESVSISGTTSVIFAGDAMISITSESVTGEYLSSNRRNNDRRQTERRTNATIVQFERRIDETRRMGQRRAA